MIDPKKTIIRFLVNRRRHAVERKYYKKIESFRIGDTGSLDQSIIREHRDLWQPLSRTKVDDRWAKLYAGSNGIKSHRYVPEYLYYSTIEPILNKFIHDASYADKNVYDLIYDNGIFPETILRNMEGSLYDGEYMPVHDFEMAINRMDSDRIVVKPSIDSGGGANVELFERSGSVYKNRNGKVLDLLYLDEIYGKNYLIQKVIDSHAYFAQFNPTSLNTVRIFTYRSVKTNGVIILQAVLRVGAAGHFVDNQRAGGYAIGIDEDGILNNFAINKYGEKTESILESVQDRQIFLFRDLCEKAMNIAKKNLYHRVLGLDMAVDHKGNVRCIEVNNRGNEINFFQLNNGPLFKDYTEEIVGYCLQNQAEQYNYHIIK